MSSSKPYILFYSNKCKYSAEVLKKTTTNPSITSLFLYVNLDNKGYTIPTFVDRVPLIYIKDTRELVIDYNISLFINQLSQQRQSAPQQQSEKHLESLSDMSKGISSSFSFMNENEDKLTPMNYVFLGKDTQPTMDVSSSSTEERGNKIDSSCFDAYKNQRDLDDANFFPRRSGI